MVRGLIAALLLAAAASPVTAQPAPAPAAPPPQTVVVHAGRLIAEPGRPAQGPSTITIAGDKIQGIAQGLQPAPPGARLIDHSGRTVLPGLIDAHVHLAGDPDSPFWSEATRPTNG